MYSKRDLLYSTPHILETFTNISSYFSKTFFFCTDMMNYSVNFAIFLPLYNWVRYTKCRDMVQHHEKLYNERSWPGTRRNVKLFFFYKHEDKLTVSYLISTKTMFQHQGFGSGSVSGSRRAKMTQKIEKTTEFSSFEVLHVLFWGLKASPVAWASFMEA